MPRNCDMCGGGGMVYRARVVDGKAFWGQANEVPAMVECPRCYMDALAGPMLDPDTGGVW